jgi:hypothetical protein
MADARHTRLNNRHVFFVKLEDVGRPETSNANGPAHSAAMSAMVSVISNPQIG